MAEKVKPEIVAAITAALQAVMKNGKVLAVKIKRSENWSLAAKNIK